MPKTNYYCPECGSDSIFVDTTMSWEVEKQEWEAGEPCSEYTCNDCSEDFSEPDDGFVNEKGERVNEDGTAYVADQDDDDEDQDDGEEDAQ